MKKTHHHLMSCKPKLASKIILIFIIFFLTSCTLYQKPTVPAIKTPDHFKPTIKITNSKLKEKWWENFHDATLNRLVAVAIKNNYNYQVAIKNIQIACTYVTQAQSALFPQVNLSFNTSRNKSPSTLFNGTNSTSPINPSNPNFARIFNLQQLIGTVSYQLDVWNQLGNGVNQAKANQTVSEAEARVIKLSLITSVVNTYFQIQTLNANLTNLHQQYRFANNITKLTTTQLQGGITDGSTVDIAKNQAEVIKSNIDNLEKQKQVLQNTLAYLLGEYPENFNLAIHHDFKYLSLENLIPPNLPSIMLANRPDIQAAYYQILSYGYLEKQNIANFLPVFNLTGNYGYASTALSNLLSSAHSYWNYGLYTTQFIFDYQTRMSEYKRSVYQYKSAILSYRDTVLNAFNEVDSALISYKKDNEALLSFQKQTRNTKDLLSLSNAQYRGGLADYSTYLTTNLTYLQSNYNMANQRLAVIEDIIQVYNSLGLGL